MSAPSPAQMVRVERDGAVGVVTLDRPDKRNALDLAMRGAIAAAVTELDCDEAVHVIVITGAGGVFAAGADLNLLVDKGAQAVADIDLSGPLGGGDTAADYTRCRTHRPLPFHAVAAGGMKAAPTRSISGRMPLGCENVDRRATGVAWQRRR